MVPAEGIEPPTFGLQNRCSTAELSRHLLAYWDLGQFEGHFPKLFVLSPDLRFTKPLLYR